MRSNSGKGKSKSNLRDPTMKEHAREHGKGKRAAPADRAPIDETSDA